MMNTKFAVGCALLCLALVDATNTNLRGAESAYTKRKLQQFLGGGPINPEDCPLTDPEKVCDSTIIKVLNCRGCKYDNNCLASGAGFLIRRECQLNALLLEDPEGFSNLQNCPLVPPTELCLDLIARVTCGGCEYGNGCLAEEAGFDVDSECKLVATPPPVEEDFINPVFLKNCPVPNPAVLCFDNDYPVVCGPKDCEYNSTCAAKAAGLNTTSCELAPFDQSFCEPPSFVANFCLGGESVQCGQCIYDSFCIASSAGYSFLDCGPVPDPELEPAPEPEPEQESEPETNTTIAESVPEPEPISCDIAACRKPLPAIVISCGISVSPVVCKGCCNFNNPCLAAGAGFNPQLDCQVRNAAPDVDTAPNSNSNSDTEPLPDLAPADCPGVTDDIPCTGSSKPVLCRGCEYFNRCFAAGAGFNGNTCLLKGPAPVVANIDKPTSSPTDQPTDAPAPVTLAPPPTSPPTATVVVNVDDQPADEPATLTPPPTSPSTDQPTDAPAPATPAPPPTSPPTDQPTDAPAPKCPPESNNESCPPFVNRVNCPGDCEYRNLCKAKEAGFTGTQCSSSFTTGFVQAPAPAFGNSLGGFDGGSSTSEAGDSTPSFLSQLQLRDPLGPSGFGTFP
jgi:hypothetical protein